MLLSLCLSSIWKSSEAFIKVPLRCIAIIEILRDARRCSSRSREWLEGVVGSPNRKVWFKDGKRSPLCLPVDLKVARRRPASGTSSTQGPSFPRTWRIYFTAVSDTADPPELSRSSQIRIDRLPRECFEFPVFLSGAGTDQLLLDEHTETQRRAERQRQSRGAIVRSLRRRNPLTSFTFCSKVERIPKPNRFINFWIKGSSLRCSPAIASRFCSTLVILFTRSTNSRDWIFDNRGEGRVCAMRGTIKKDERKNTSFTILISSRIVRKEISIATTLHELLFSRSAKSRRIFRRTDFSKIHRKLHAVC